MFVSLRVPGSLRVGGHLGLFTGMLVGMLWLMWLIVKLAVVCAVLAAAALWWLVLSVTHRQVAAWPLSRR